MNMPLPKQNPANSTFMWEVGSSPSHTITAASTNPTVVKASPGTIVGIACFNSTASVAWLKLHDAASAPVAGTTPVTLALLIPASTAGNGFILDIPIEFSAGIAFTVTGSAADADASASPAGLAINILYR
jgi:hypothetical protein